MSVAMLPMLPPFECIESAKQEQSPRGHCRRQVVVRMLQLCQPQPHYGLGKRPVGDRPIIRPASVA